MIKKIIGQDHPEEVPMDILRLLCDLESLRFEPPIDTLTFEEVLNTPINKIDDTTAYAIFNNCRIYMFPFPLYQGNIYLGEYIDRISLSNVHPDTGKSLDDEPLKNLPESFLDRIAFFKAARMLALEDQCKIIRSDEGFPHRELNIAYLTNF